MKVKNITDGPRAVPLLDGRVVEPGEVVEVPEFQPGHTEENPLPIVWPESTWQVVPEKAPGKTVKVTSDPAAAKE